MRVDLRASRRSIAVALTFFSLISLTNDVASACESSVRAKLVAARHDDSSVAIRLEDDSRDGDDSFRWIRLLEFDTTTGQFVKTHEIVTEEEASNARLRVATPTAPNLKSIRARRWKDVEAKLLASGYKMTPSLAPLDQFNTTQSECSRFRLSPDDVVLSLSIRYEDADASNYADPFWDLVAQRGTTRAIIRPSLYKQSESPNERSCISQIYMTPGRRYLVVLDGAYCKVFEAWAISLDDLRARLSKAEQQSEGVPVAVPRTGDAPRKNPDPASEH